MMRGLSSLHRAAALVLASKAYSPYDYSQQSHITQLRGVGVQIQKPTPEYEIGYHIKRRDANTLNVYCRTGADSYQQTTGYGNVVARTFLTDIMEFSGDANDRVYVYQPTDYAVFEHCEYIINGAVWMFTKEKDRATQTIRRFMVQISTDGLTGRAFGAPIQVASGGVNVTDDLLFMSNAITDNNGDLWLHFSCESPAGLFRMKVNPSFDGTFSNYARTSSVGGGVSEAAIAPVDNTGKLICVYRVNSGSYLMMLTSSDYGATWSGAGISTGLGVSTGVKVQPRILQSADPNRFIVLFSDRVPPQIDKVSTLNLKPDAFGNAYRAVTPLGSGATNGNGDIILLDADQALYLYVACNQAGSNAPNGLSYWVFKDSRASGRRPLI